MEYKPTSTNSSESSLSNVELFEDIYRPDRAEEYIEKNLDKMYTGRAPTMRQVRDAHGDAVINLWLGKQIQYMFNLTDVNLDQVKTNDLIRLIRAKYQWLKVTEFMHYVFLFRTGEFGKIYGKADGQTVMLTMKEYCKLREDKLADIRQKQCKAEQQDTMDAPRNYDFSGISTRLLAQMNESLKSGFANWRKEPWGPVLSRWYNCTCLPSLRSQNMPILTLIENEEKYFPGNWTYEQRRDFARTIGYKDAV